MAYKQGAEVDGVGGAGAVQYIEAGTTVTGSQDIKALESLVLEIRENQFKNRMKHKTGQLNESHLLTVDRKKIAQIKTIINEKKSEEAPA